MSEQREMILVSPLSDTIQHQVPANAYLSLDAVRATTVKPSNVKIQDIGFNENL
jgi:hypothetical protein